MVMVYANYEPSIGWAYPILQALRDRADWPHCQRVWRTGRLSDLAFSIETRVGGLAEAESLLVEYLQTVIQSGFRDARVPLEGLAGTAHRFRNTSALRRTLLASTYFVADARACFENLADFYREFLREFLGESISVGRSREMIPNFSTADEWATKLWEFRNDLLHERAPWLAFEVGGSSESLLDIRAILTLDWRHGTIGQGMTIDVGDFSKIRTGLGESLAGVRNELLRQLRVGKA